jgi:hypothetical protein
MCVRVKVGHQIARSEPFETHADIESALTDYINIMIVNVKELEA